MVTIRLNTWIDAPVERCFRLATSVDFHIVSAKPMRERLMGGPSGFLREGQTVTWRAWHFGLPLRHTAKMEILRPFSHIREVMISGVFKFYEHDHHFAVMDDGTRVRDELRFAAPLGPVGRIVERMILRRYLTVLLTWRNKALKRVAESEEWHQYLDGPLAVKAVTRRPGTFMSFDREIQG